MLRRLWPWNVEKRENKTEKKNKRDKNKKNMENKLMRTRKTMMRTKVGRKNKMMTTRKNGMTTKKKKNLIYHPFLPHHHQKKEKKKMRGNHTNKKTKKNKRKRKRNKSKKRDKKTKKMKKVKKKKKKKKRAYVDHGGNEWETPICQLVQHSSKNVVANRTTTVHVTEAASSHPTQRRGNRRIKQSISTQHPYVAQPVFKVQKMTKEKKKILDYLVCRPAKHKKE